MAIEGVLRAINVGTSIFIRRYSQCDEAIFVYAEITYEQHDRRHVSEEYEETAENKHVA